MFAAVQSEDCLSGEVRINGTGAGTRGRLEFCDNQVWFALESSSQWNSSVAMNLRMVCQLLGLPTSGMTVITRA